MGYSSCENLEVWKRACTLAVDVCRTSGSIRIFALRNQLQRAAISVPSNIAEGADRDSNPDFVRFLRIAKGSIAEMRTQLRIARDLEQLEDPDFQRLDGEARQIGAMLKGLINHLLGSSLSLREFIPGATGTSTTTPSTDSETIEP